MRKFQIIILLVFISHLTFAQKANVSKIPVDSLRIVVSGEDVYGKACGIAGVDPKLRIEMDQLLLENEFTTIFSWLESNNIVRQVYAVEAISKTNYLQLLISKKQKSIINELKKSQKYISTCSGCKRFKQTVAEILMQFPVE